MYPYKSVVLCRASEKKFGSSSDFGRSCIKLYIEMCYQFSNLFIIYIIIHLIHFSPSRRSKMIRSVYSKIFLAKKNLLFFLYFLKIRTLQKITYLHNFQPFCFLHENNHLTTSIGLYQYLTDAKLNRQFLQQLCSEVFYNLRVIISFRVFF